MCVLFAVLMDMICVLLGPSFVVRTSQLMKKPNVTRKRRDGNT